MRTLAHRIGLGALLGLALSACGCKDPASNDFGIELVDPLTVTYAGGRYKVNAQANIRVDWRVEFSNLSRGCTIETRRVCDFWDDTVLQERVVFTWNPRLPPQFFSGDSIQAQVSTNPPLKPDQAERAVVYFVFGQGPEPPPVQIP